MRVWKFLILLLGMNSSFAHAFTPQNPLAAWTNTFLVNQVFLEEYRSITSPNLSQKNREKMWRSDYGVNVWQRASFAMHKAKEARQDLGDTVALRAMLLEQQGFLKKKSDKQFRQLEKFLVKGVNDPKWIEDTFSQDKNRQYFHALSASYAQNGEVCALRGEEYATTESLLKDLTRNDDPHHIKPLIEFLAKLPVDKKRCLAIQMLQHQDTTRDYETLPLFLALRSTSDGEKDLIVTLATSIRYIQMENYPETLRLLFQLQKADSAYRSAYDLVQVIYSYRQRGEGDVALRGL